MLNSIRRTVATLTAASLAFSLTACSGHHSGAADSDKPLKIATSTNIWGDVAKSVVGDTADVQIDPVIKDNSVDPHEFEPSAAQLARASQADIVVVGGGGYDAWLTKTLGEKRENKNQVIVHALPLESGEHKHEGGASGDHVKEEAHDGAFNTIDDNEHIWYNTAAVSTVANDIAQAVNKSKPNAHADATRVSNQMNDLSTKLKALPERNVAQTETVADYMLDGTAMKDLTPKGYRSAALSESEPSAADLAAFLDLVNGHRIDTLLFNPQAENDQAERIKDAATKNNIKVVELGETPPENTNFLDYYRSVVETLQRS